jgi:hypothetical protein
MMEDEDKFLGYVIGERGTMMHGLIPVVRSNGNVVGLFADRQYALRAVAASKLFDACILSLMALTNQRGVTGVQALNALRSALAAATETGIDGEADADGGRGSNAKN